MTVNKQDAEALQSVDIAQDKCEQIETQIIQILNNSELNLRELVFVLANLLVDTGGSLEGTDIVLTAENVQRLYLEKPTLGRAMMCMGMDVMIDWLEVSTKSITMKGENE